MLPIAYASFLAESEKGLNSVKTTEKEDEIELSFAQKMLLLFSLIRLKIGFIARSLLWKRKNFFYHFISAKQHSEKPDQHNLF